MINTCPAFFAARLKETAIAKQTALFAKADAIDAAAVRLRRSLVVSPKIDKLLAEAAALRNEACVYGDRYHRLVHGS